MYNMIDSLVDKKLVLQAVKILREVTEKYYENPSKKKPLIEEESPLFLQVTMKKIPKNENIKMIRINLPHSLVKDTADVCLITGDLDKKNHKAEIEPDKLHYKELLDKNGISEISEVITLRQLRTEYRPFEAKLKLLAAYDVFLADNVILECLPKILGRHFFKKRKYPIRINMKTKNLKKEISKAISSKMFYITGRGNSCCVEIAFLDMKTKKIVANVLSVVEALSKELPGAWDNVLGIYLKTAKSKAVPIYVSYDNPNDVKLPVVMEEDEFEIDELTTIPNALVKVYKDGRVETVKNSTVHMSQVEEIDLESSFHNTDKVISPAEKESKPKESATDHAQKMPSEKKIKTKKSVKHSTMHSSQVEEIDLEPPSYNTDEEVIPQANKKSKAKKSDPDHTPKMASEKKIKAKKSVKNNTMDLSQVAHSTDEEVILPANKKSKVKKSDTDNAPKTLSEKKIKSKKSSMHTDDASIAESNEVEEGRKKSKKFKRKKTESESEFPVLGNLKKSNEVEEGSKTSNKSKRKRTESESEFPVFGNLESKPEFIRSQKKIRLDDLEVKNALENKQKFRNKKKQNLGKAFKKY